MLNSSHDLIYQILISFVLWVFIVTGFTGITLGIGLNFSSARTLRFLKTMNRWISMRNSLKPLEKSHDIDKVIYRHRRWFGAVFAISGAYTVLMLLFEVEFPYVVAALSKNTTPVIVELLVECLRWFLVLGGVLAVVIGILMLVSTYALPPFEARINRWYSLRKLGKGADEMHMTLDELAAAFPRTAGLLLAFGSAIVLIAAMIVWL